MNNNIIELFNRKDNKNNKYNDNIPWVTNKAMCLACGYEWSAVAEAGVDVLKCPNCGLKKGYMESDFAPNCEILECNCGCQLFLVTRNGIFCPNCGEQETFAVMD